MSNAPGSNSVHGIVPGWGQQAVTVSGGGGGGGDLVTSLDTYRGWTSAANFYQAPAGTLPGAAAFVAAILVRNRFNSAGGPGKSVFGTLNFTGNAGWAIGFQGNGAASAQIFDGAAANIVVGAGVNLYSPSLARGRLELVMLRYSGTALQLWINGGFVEAGATTAGFTAGGAPQAYVGREVTFGDSFPDGEVRGLAYYEGTVTEDNIVDSFDETVANMRFTAAGAIPWSNLWTATGAPPATWSDEVAALALTRNGALTLGSCPALLI